MADTLIEASQQPNVQGALQQLLMSRIRSASQVQDNQQKRQQALENYQKELTSPQFQNYTATDFGFDTALENMGRLDFKDALSAGAGAGGKFLSTLEQADRKGRVEAAKAGYDDTKDSGKLDLYELQAMKSLAGGKSGMSPTVKMDRDGNMVVYQPWDGTSRVVHSSQRGEYQRVWKAAYEKAVAEEQPNPEAYAHNVALQVLQEGPKAGLPDGGSGAGTPAVSTAPVTQNPDTASLNFPGMTPFQVKQLIDRIQDPQAKVEAQAAFDKQFGSDPAEPQLQYRDRRKQEQDKGYGSAEGKGLYDEYQTLGQLGSANSKLISQLNLLESIYKDPHIPEGEIAPVLQSMRSSLKGLGFSVDPSVGLTDLATAIGTGMALSLKSADGKNLLPGAMSNYEDQLLQKMAPTLGRTSEGRLALIAFMKMVAGANMRLTSEATKLASENGDRLPASWPKRRERVMLEEKVKLKQASQKLIERYGVQ